MPKIQNQLLACSEPDDWGETLWNHRKKAREDAELHGSKREWTFRKLARRWENVKKGMAIDIDVGKQQGETTPPEYWSRVWSDMHYGNGGPPGNLPNEYLRDKWTEMKNTGNTDTECWDNLEIQYPVAFLGLPLLNRWEKLGEGNSMDETKGDMFGWMAEFNRIFLQKDLKVRLEEMSRSGEEETFWRVNWDTIYKSKSVDQDMGGDETCSNVIFPVNVKNEDGELVRKDPTYKQYYPTEFGEKNFRIKRPKPVDDPVIYKQFDFI